MDYNLTVTKEAYPLAVLKTINCFLNLTDLELTIISKMISGKMKDLNTINRKKLIESLDGVSEANFNNYIRRLKNKKVLLLSDNELVINNNILTAISDGELNFKFNVN